MIIVFLTGKPMYIRSMGAIQLIIYYLTVVLGHIMYVINLGAIAFKLQIIFGKSEMPIYII